MWIIYHIHSVSQSTTYQYSLGPSFTHCAEKDNNHVMKCAELPTNHPIASIPIFRSI